MTLFLKSLPADKEAFASDALPEETKAILTKIATAIRVLSMDAIQKANSGHPGMPLGCAELGAYLYGTLLRHNPKQPAWLNRDRLVLSAGHGSMWLYSCLHLAGFDLSLEDLKHFRQLHSKTPGHPEYNLSRGVEATTGPLGQGIGNGVGQALGLKLLAKRFNTPKYQILDSKVYVLAGDGCLMEGTSSEASSLAGHLGLNNLVLIYDANGICLDGPLAECCSEDIPARYRAYGWDVYEVDGHDFDQIHQVFSHIQATQQRPCLVKAHTLIGKGAPNRAGTHLIHGAPLGPEEIRAARQSLQMPLEEFFVPQSVRNYFEAKIAKDVKKAAKWQETVDAWSREQPAEAALFQKMATRALPSSLEERLKELVIASPVSGRKASQEVFSLLSELLPQLIGGSADLSSSDCTMIKSQGVVKPWCFEGRNIKFGVREFGMGTMAVGLAQTQMLTPLVGTFFAFSDYLRNALRMAALSHLQVIYQFTHDSIFLGEDGPTHQPVEHLASLRAVPGVHVIRPADANEVKGAWIAAVGYQGPTALVLSRQKLPALPGTDLPFAEGVGRGAYLLRREKSQPDFTLVATGSEVSLALAVADELERLGKAVRVISMPCWELFEDQPADYKISVFGGSLGKRVSIEAGVELGWHKYIGSEGQAISVDDFGLSAPATELAIEFGFTVESILERIL